MELIEFRQDNIGFIFHNQPIGELADRVIQVRSGNIVDIKVNKSKNL